MARKGRSPIFAIILVIGVIVLAFGLVQTEFPDLIPFSLVSAQPNVSCVGVSCEWQFGGIFLTSGVAVKTDRIPIDLIDLNEPVIISYTVSVSSGGGDFRIVAKTDVSVVTIDANGIETKELIRTVNQGTTDITADLQGKTGFLEYDYTPATCPSACVITLQLRDGGLITSFSLDPPEIDETSNPMLKQVEFLAGSDIIQTSPRFAVAESFQIQNPTVITSFEMQLATQDPDAVVTGYVWNLDKSPPERIVQSTETFTGAQITPILGKVKFTFPNAVALLPDIQVQCITTPCNPVPINYAVGIRVSGNLALSFGYLQADATPDTHGGVIDTNPSINDESSFSDHGIIGIDIFHDPAKAQELLTVVEEIICEADEILVDNVCETVEQDPTISILCIEGFTRIGDECVPIVPDVPSDDDDLIVCIAIFPPPPACTPKDEQGNLICPQSTELRFDSITGQQSCKLILNEGECSGCNAPPPLQIQPTIPTEVFLISGVVIIGIGITGVIIRRR